MLSDRLSLDQPLSEFGLDSLKVVEIKNYVETHFGLILPIEVFLDEITIEKLVSQIRSGATLPTLNLESSGVPVLSKPSSQNDLEVFDQSANPSARIAKTGMQFSLFYFSSNEAEFADNKYRLLIEGAKFADQNEFAAVWVPERHFHAFGGLYPNPSVLGAALAMVTKRVRIRAGSVVLPLQNPVRVTEDWSVVDNLSHGRVDLAFAAGWNPNDFTLAPENYRNRTEAMFSGMQTVQKLWRGESIALPNGVGKSTEIKIYPLPKQRDLSVWTTCTGGKERFIEAGAAGTNVLTALLFQSIEELAEKITLYREARAQHGHDPKTGHITLMLHTFVSEELKTVRSKVREPFIEYLKTSVGLWRQGSDNLDDLSPKQQEDLLNYAFERYYQTSTLFGTPDSCLERVDRLAAIGVNEIACLIDFGLDVDSTMAGLYSLKKLKALSNKADKASVNNKASATIAHHYDAVSKLNDVYAFDESFLTFGIFPEKIPNFSWISTFYNPQAYPEHAQIALQSQLELRNILFGDLDFSTISKVLDFGCGHASDLIRLGKTYPHLQLTGYTISAKQAETDSQKIEKLQLQERINIYNRDSAKDAFPNRYDLIFGFEVAVYVKQKEDLFSNISSHLNEGGTVLLAEFISNTFSSIDHQETSSYIITAKEWVELFSANNLKVVKFVEISQEVANFLYDPNFKENLANLNPELVDAVVNAHFTSWDNLGKLLESQLASYVLIVLQKDSKLSQDDIRTLNQNSLTSPTPYAKLQRSALPTPEIFLKHQKEKATSPENHLQALRNKQISSKDETLHSTVVDLKAEAVLDETIRPATPLTEPVINPDHIFLTGATGFLGAFLLYELLEQTSSQLHCLVRATNPERGMQRIRENLQTYGLWRDRFNDRIVTVVGDLSQPWLGLTLEQFDSLAQQLDLIYHNAAYLNFVYPYAALKPINVLGTQEVLRLACQSKTKPVHYISSTAVFDASSYASKIVTEQENLDHSSEIAVGYAQSKWVAERLVSIAGDRGLPISIYRPAWIFGHSETGVCNKEDFICRLMKGCIQMGVAPEMDYVWNISPVDYVSQATVHLSRQQDGLGKIFHLISPHPLHWNHLVDWMRSLGYSIDRLPYEEWQSKLRNLSPTQENPLYPLIPLFLGHWTDDKLTIAQLYQQDKMPQLGCPETLKALVGSQLDCPPVNSDLLNTYFSYFLKSGLLEKPAKLNNSQLSLDKPDLTPLISQNETSEAFEADSIATWLVSQVAQQLRTHPQNIDPHEAFTCYSLDSVQAVSLVSALEEWLGCELSPDLLNSYPTIEALSQYLAQHTHTDKTTALAATSLAPILNKQPNFLQKIMAYLFWGFVKLLYNQWFQMSCWGLENIPHDRPYLVAANHTSHLDGQAIAVALAKNGDRISILAAQDYFFDHPVKSWLCKTFLHMIPLDRQGNFLKGMQECQETLARHKPVLIFPEGTRSLTGKMQPFQPGLGWLALQLNVPILPVYIDGAYEALPKGKWFPRPHPIQIVIGKPLELSPYKAKQGTVPDREICQEIVDEVQSEIAQMRDNYPL